MPAQARDREQLGRLLVRRRVEMKPAYRNRRTFAAERGIEYNQAYRVERGIDIAFEEATKAVIESAYGLAPGSFDYFIASGELVLAESASPDGQPLHESRAELEQQILAADRATVEGWRHALEHAQAKLSESLAVLAEHEQAFAAGHSGRESGPRAL